LDIDVAIDGDFLCVLIALFVCLTFNACTFSLVFGICCVAYPICSTDLPFTFKGTQFLGDKPGGFCQEFRGVVVRSHKRGEPVFCH